MSLATTYPLLEVFWTMLIFFAFIVWIWILFTVIADLFRRRDISAWGKVGWVIFVVILPYLGMFVYLIAEHKGMTERAVKQQEAAQGQFAGYVQSVAGMGDPAEQIVKGKALLDQGADLADGVRPDQAEGACWPMGHVRTALTHPLLAGRCECAGERPRDTRVLTPSPRSKPSATR